MSMNTYRAVWMLFLVIIVLPAFVMASGMEGLDFEQASIFTLQTLEAYGIPHIIAIVIGYPVTVVATVIPGTSTLMAMLGNFIWSGLGIFFLFLFLVNIEPPFYKATETQTEV